MQIEINDFPIPKLLKNNVWHSVTSMNLYICEIWGMRLLKTRTNNATILLILMQFTTRNHTNKRPYSHSGVLEGKLILVLVIREDGWCKTMKGAFSFFKQEENSGLQQHLKRDQVMNWTILNSKRISFHILSEHSLQLRLTVVPKWNVLVLPQATCPL